MAGELEARASTALSLQGKNSLLKGGYESLKKNSKKI
jgi:hypothetical protein